jgi:CheY-specific phosphatase CheX
MERFPDLIAQIVQLIWTQSLGLEVEPADTHPPTATSDVEALVGISGAWEGAVIVRCSARLARRAAGVMFALGDSEPGATESAEAIAELANMTGGNFKANLPEPSQLSLPVLRPCASDPSGLPETRAVSRVDFLCEGEPLMVTVVQHI